jgi:hypothetical protein
MKLIATGDGNSMAEMIATAFEQTLDKIKLLVPIQIADQGKRRILLHIGEAACAVRCLLNFEDASYDLTRLYRLSRGCAALYGQIDHGLRVHRGCRLPDEECKAVDCGRGVTSRCKSWRWIKS